MSGQVIYHEGVFGEEVPAGYFRCSSRCVGVRSGWPSTEPAADCPDYKDSEGKKKKGKARQRLKRYGN